MLMATAFFRTIILYLLLIAGLRLTGKRQIGELEPTWRRCPCRTSTRR